MSKKTFVLDTNVLLYDPEAILKFPRHTVVFPLTVLEELDEMKRLPNELGKNSRAVIRQLAALAKHDSGDWMNGITLENGGTAKILLEHKTDFAYELNLSIKDNKILMAAYLLKEKGETVVFVSKDLAARIKGEAIGLTVQDYENYKFSYANIYKGVQKITVSKREVDTFFKDTRLQLSEQEAFRPNEYFVMTSPEHSSAVGKYNKTTDHVEPLIKLPNVWGIKPLNVEQKCAIDALLRDDVKLVTLMGPAGTGKTLLALACGMRKVFDEGVYSKVLVSRPIVPLGRDIGYLPGTKEEKLTPWMQPIYDNLEFVCAASDGSDPSETLRWVMDSQKIEMEAVTYIRGRSLPNMFIIVDEAQNLTPHEVKTIISRAGEGTKVILTGDPTQIDNPYLDKDSNGLTYTVGMFNSYPLYAQVFLEKTERSQLAALAIEVL